MSLPAITAAALRPPITYSCQAQGCQHVIHRGHLMCNDHWRMVPAMLRREVWSAYRVWRMGLAAGRDATSYLAAKQAAIDAVAAKQRARQARHDAGTDLLF